jgi:tetratricopeptide (TPR) repeat protein
MLLLAALAACGVFALREASRPPEPKQRAAAVPPRVPAARPAEAPPPPTTLAAPQRVVEVPVEAGIPAKDHDAALQLSTKINNHQPISLGDLRVAEELSGRYSREPKLRELLEATLLTLAGQERSQHRFAEAAGSVRRAIALNAEEAPPRIALMDLLIEAGDWTGAEAAARDALRLLPRDRGVLEGLAYSLFRQDRNREAAEYYRTVVELGGSPTARGYLDRIQKNLSDEQGMTEQRLSHFHVRYDGGEHDDVGREILRVLERHFATLATSFDHQLVEPVPVILFSQQAYYDAAGAPAWSGGVFDHADGRIRVPIGGLTSALTPDMDDVLIHELTHAFINDRSHGLAPREVHEGMAQYLEGKRLASMLSDSQMRGLADGRLQGVGGFYLQALCFAEYMISVRGQGGVNEVLKAMADTGSVDDAFRQVYGQDYAATRQLWWNHFRQQYGSASDG